MSKLFQFDIGELNLTVDNFHPHYLDETGEKNLQIVEAINEIISSLPDYCNIVGGYVNLNNISFESNHCIRVQDKLFEAGKVVYNMLKKSEQLYVFLCTAGKGMSEWSRNLFIDGDLLKGYLVDMAGSLIVDLAVDILEKNIEIEAADNEMFITNRYSPGYCNWNVSEQQQLFSFFPENFCGVSLSSSSLMLPEKSVSGMIGAGAKVKKVPYTCAICGMENCLYSKSKRVVSQAL